MISTVLISGGAGFIGTRLATRILESTEDRVVLLDNLHPQVHSAGVWPLAESERLTHVEGDVVDISAWERALDAITGPISVVHLAAETGTGQSLTEARRHASVNTLGTATLTDSLTSRGIRPTSILLCSSRAVYGEGLWVDAEGGRHYADLRGPVQLELQEWAPRAKGRALDHPVPHNAAEVEPRPTNIYAATKLAQEHVLDAWTRSMDVPLTVLRLQNVYGAGQALQNSYTGVLTYFARQLLSGETVNVYEGGGIVRDFVHVTDVVEAIRSALESPTSGRRVLDIGSGEPQTLLDVATLMAELVHGSKPLVTNRYRPGDVRAAFADISAAKTQLGYKPTTTLREGLRGLLDYAEAGLART